MRALRRKGANAFCCNIDPVKDHTRFKRLQSLSLLKLSSSITANHYHEPNEEETYFFFYFERTTLKNMGRVCSIEEEREKESQLCVSKWCLYEEDKRTTTKKKFLSAVDDNTFYSNAEDSSFHIPFASR